jgi:hypothetical protein
MYPQAVTAYSFVMTCALMLVLKYTIGVREQYNPNMDPEEFSKLGVRIGGPGALEGSLVLPPGACSELSVVPVWFLAVLLARRCGASTCLCSQRPLFRCVQGCLRSSR